MADNLKRVLEVLKTCIENGHEVKKLCDESPDAVVKTNPVIKQFIDKINNETSSLEKMKQKILELINSDSNKDFNKWKNELRDVINSMDSISTENVTQIIEALARSKTSKARKNFETHMELVNNFQGNDVTKNFARILIERNQKIIDCLNHVVSMLPKTDTSMRAVPVSPKSKRKLFIYSEDLHRSISSPSRSQKTPIGSVTIHSDDGTGQSTSSAVNTSQSMVQRRVLNGFLQDEVSGMEVVLELKEPHDQSNLMDFSSTLGKHSATLAIEGGGEENIDVFELNLMDMPLEGAPVIAVVQNEATGLVENVPIQLVPVEPMNNVHGRVIEIQSPEAAQHGAAHRSQRQLNFDEGALTQRVINQAFDTAADVIADSLIVTDIVNKTAAPNWFTGRFSEPFDESIHLTLTDDENSILPAIENQRTPVYLTPPKSPRAPLRHRDSLVRGGLQARGLDFTQDSVPRKRRVTRQNVAALRQFQISPNRKVPSYVSPRKRTQVRNHSLAYATPSRVRRGLIPSRTAIPEPRRADLRFNWTPERENLNDAEMSLIDDSFGEVNQSQRQKTPQRRSPARPRTPRSGRFNWTPERENLNDAEMSLVDDSFGEVNQSQRQQTAAPNWFTGRLSDVQPFDESIHLTLTDDENSILPAIENVRTPVYLTPPKSPRAPLRRRDTLVRGGLQARGLDFAQDSVPRGRSPARPRSPRTTTPRSGRFNWTPERENLFDADMSLINDSFRGTEAQTPQRSGVNEGILVNITPEKTPRTRTVQFNNSDLLQLSDDLRTQGEERIADEIEEAVNESLQQAERMRIPDGPTRTPERRSPWKNRGFDYMNQLLEKPLEDYLDKTPIMNVTPPIMQRSAYEGTPRTTRFRNTSMPLTLKVPQQNFNRSTIDRSLNSAYEARQRRLEEASANQAVSSAQFLQQFDVGNDEDLEGVGDDILLADISAYQHLPEYEPENINLEDISQPDFDSD